MGQDAMILVFWMLSFKLDFSLFSFTLKRLSSSSSLSAIRVVSSAYLRFLIFHLPILIPAWVTQPSILHEVLCKHVGLDELQAGIKIGRRNINSLRYADDTTLMAESEEELKSLLMRVKEESEWAGLKLGIKNTKIVASSPIT